MKKMNRRQFMANTGAAAGGALLLGSASVKAATRSSKRLRVALVGTGVRGCSLWGRNLVENYSDYVQMVGLCDHNPGRVNYAKQYIGCDCPVFTDLEELVRKQKPETLIVTTEDSAHHKIIVRGLELGCNIITEKPLTIDEKKAQAIIDAERKSGKNVIVTFNYRYPPYRAKIKELLMQGLVGEITSAEFQYYLSDGHLAEYMRRWHGEACRGGTLWVHKGTHHFDMANWFIDSEPKEVFAYATLERFGSNGAFRGKSCRNCAHSGKCAYFWDITKKEHLYNLYTKNEQYDGYVRDNCVFRHQIDIFSKHSAVIKYANGVYLNYSLTGDSDYEGYWIAFNGTRGRLEARIEGFGSKEYNELVFIPNSRFSDKPAQIIKAEHQPGGHWGGDPIMLDKIFVHPDKPDPLGQQAGVRDGVMSILIGIAARTSVYTGKPVNIADLTDLTPMAKRPVKS
ncbi:gfo/Idh/MocA family oxidoreductase [candidate division KSB1 bacterium]|nr:gfo/Idh/MocA family oxidoreductase [candidate division KSB1 bacterium]